MCILNKCIFEQPQRPFTYANRSHKEQNQYIGTHRLDLVFMATWGRSDFMGLTGIEIMGDAESGIILSQCNLSCNFKANLSSLTDGENLTDDPKHMWTVACDPLKHVIITIKFDAYTYIAGNAVWYGHYKDVNARLRGTFIIIFQVYEFGTTMKTLKQRFVVRGW